MKKTAPDGARELIVSAMEILNGLNQVLFQMQAKQATNWKAQVWLPHTKLQDFKPMPNALKKDTDKLQAQINKIGEQGPQNQDATTISQLQLALVLAQQLMNDVIWSLDNPHFINAA